MISRAGGEMQDAQARTVASLLLVSSVLLIMGAVLSNWLAGRDLRPVRKIATTARSISERDLSRGVDVKVPPDEMDNLVDNAIRHSPYGSAVTMRAVVADGGWNVEVVDRGPGVPPDHRERLFSRFSRPDTARSQDEGGAGLGLALSAAIASAHGGSLELVENGATGAFFRLHLPAGRKS